MSEVQKPRAIKILQWIHLSVFLLTVGMIIAAHNLPSETLVLFRIPRFLKEIDIFLGFPWPASLHVYQSILLLFLFLTLIDGVGLFFSQHKFWQLVSDFSSFLTFFLVWTVFIFFIFSLTLSDGFYERNIETALLFLFLTFILLVLELATFAFDEKHLGRRLIKKFD